MAKYTVTYANGNDVFVELVEVDKVDSQGVEVLFLRDVIGWEPGENKDKDVVVAGFPRDRLLSFIAEVVDDPAKTDVASKPAFSRYVA